MKLKVFTAFSGYDSQCLALDRLHEQYPLFEYELVGWSEIDKYAIQAHNALYPQYADRNFGDICSIDWSNVPDFDLFTYSSPCQDFSNAGLMKGGEEGSGTRSSLLWECRRAILAKHPRYLLMENVSNLVSKRFIHLFNRWQAELSSYGYTNFAKVLNAKDYGVPQHRKRIFLVSILGEARYEFPEPFELKLRLKDDLEDDVDERYYLTDEQVRAFMKNVKGRKERGAHCDFKPREKTDIAGPITSRAGYRETDTYIKTEVYGWTRDHKGALKDRHPVDVANTVCVGKRKNTQNYVVETNTVINATKDGLCPTICAGTYVKHNSKHITNSKGGFKEVGVIEIKANTKSGKQSLELGGIMDISFPSCKNGHLRVQGGGNISPALNCSSSSKLVRVETIERIRRLTPRELFRLMGVRDAQVDIIQEAGISNTQQAKLAGNSIVVDVLYYIFDRMFVHTEPVQLTLF